MHGKRTSPLDRLKFANQEARRVLDNPKATKAQLDKAADAVKEAYTDVVEGNQ